MWHYLTSLILYEDEATNFPFRVSGLVAADRLTMFRAEQELGQLQRGGQLKLGTTSYLSVDNNMTYVDMKTGKLTSTNLYDAIENRSS